MSDSEEGFLAACLLSELMFGQAKSVVIGGVPLALVRTDEGVFAIKDRCSHADVPLSEGEVDGCTIECWLHGSQFDVRTGRPMTLPATAVVPVFPVRITGDGADSIIEISTTPMLNTPAP